MKLLKKLTKKKLKEESGYIGYKSPSFGKKNAQPDTDVGPQFAPQYPTDKETLHRLNVAQLHRFRSGEDYAHYMSSRKRDRTLPIQTQKAIELEYKKYEDEWDDWKRRKLV